MTALFYFALGALAATLVIGSMALLLLALSGGGKR